ncbi:MAG: hypothetical protein AAFX78_14035 [Cyanobacteria bacterium J06638_20]
MSRYDDPFDPQAMKRMRLFIYLIPVIGVFPAGWRLAQRKGDRKERTVCRTAVTLGMVWMLSYLLSGVGAQTAHSLPLWVLNATATSAYFGMNLWLMYRLWQRRSLHVPGISELSDRLP